MTGNYAEVEDGGQTQRPDEIYGNTPDNHRGLTVSVFRVVCDMQSSDAEVTQFRQWMTEWRMNPQLS
jgi:hypothetical protein